jgi:hypothetical protein
MKTQRAIRSAHYTKGCVELRARLNGYGEGKIYWTRGLNPQTSGPYKLRYAIPDHMQNVDDIIKGCLYSHRTTGALKCRWIFLLTGYVDKEDCTAGNEVAFR